MFRKIICGLLCLAILFPCLMAVPAQAAFTDVPAGAWYAADVEAVQRYGIFQGVGNNRFNPFGKMTLAEAITMTDRTYAYSQGQTVPSTGSLPWYQDYVDYAEKNDICWRGEFGTDYTQICSRLTMAKLFSRVVYRETALNTVTALPDVPNTSEYRPVYYLYEQGILIGSDGQGTFRPDSDITRAEVAAIMNRVLDPNKRIHTNFGGGSGETPVQTDPPGSIQEVPAVGKTDAADRFADSVYQDLLQYLREKGVKDLPKRDPALDRAAEYQLGNPTVDEKTAIRSVDSDRTLESSNPNSYEVLTPYIFSASLSVSSKPDDLRSRYRSDAQGPYVVKPSRLTSGGTFDPRIRYDSVGIAVEEIQTDLYAVRMICYGAPRPETTNGMEKIRQLTGMNLPIRYDGTPENMTAQEAMDKAALYISDLPVILLKGFIANGFEFIIADDETYERDYGSKSTAGVTSVYHRQVAVRERALRDGGTTFHEFGHVLDYLWISVRDSGMCYERYADLVEEIIPQRGYAKTSSEECFAQAFDAYMVAPSRLKEKCPAYFNLIDEALRRAEGRASVVPPAPETFVRNTALEDAVYPRILEGMREKALPGQVRRDSALDAAAAVVASGGAADWQEALQATGYEAEYVTILDGGSFISRRYTSVRMDATFLNSTEDAIDSFLHYSGLINHETYQYVTDIGFAVVEAQGYTYWTIFLVEEHTIQR